MSTDTETVDVEGVDVELSALKPLNERDANVRASNGYRRILSSIKAVGLIEPLSVYREGGVFLILDGFLRYTACKEIGVVTVPCLVYKSKQAYTFNRNVNRLSAYQEARMLGKALNTLDEKAIAATLGLTTIRHRLAPGLAKQLHPEILAAYRDNLLGRACALEFATVCHDRQRVMLMEMKRIGDYSAAYCRTLVIQTPAGSRTKKQARKAWAEDEQRQKGMLARLEHAEKQQGFYAQLYRQYSTDLLKLVFYVRKMLANAKVEAHLQANHAEVLARFRQVVGEIG